MTTADYPSLSSSVLMPIPPPTHFVEQAHDDANSRASDGVAKADPAPIHVDPVAVKPQSPLARDVLRGKGLVQLHEADVREGDAGGR